MIEAALPSIFQNSNLFIRNMNISFRVEFDEDATLFTRVSTVRMLKIENSKFSLNLKHEREFKYFRFESFKTT